LKYWEKLPKRRGKKDLELELGFIIILFGGLLDLRKESLNLFLKGIGGGKPSI